MQNKNKIQINRSEINSTVIAIKLQIPQKLWGKKDQEDGKKKHKQIYYYLKGQ